MILFDVYPQLPQFNDTFYCPLPSSMIHPDEGGQLLRCAAKNLHLQFFAYLCTSFDQVWFRVNGRVTQPRFAQFFMFQNNTDFCFIIRGYLCGIKIKVLDERNSSVTQQHVPTEEKCDIIGGGDGRR
jgi:hypothetical protein